MIKRAHECPTQIHELVQKLTDYDYCLVHLMDESEEYRDNFLRAKKQGREIILDNSIFELGIAFNGYEYQKWIERLEPTWYIIPDVLEDIQGTLENLSQWKKYKSNSKRIAVIQGRSYHELIDCYRTFTDDSTVSKIAIPFDFSCWIDLLPFKTECYRSKFHIWKEGRVEFIKRLIQEPFFNPKIPLHLLGISLPIEFLAYKNYSFIESMDSSGPIVHGLKGVRYDEIYGLNYKESQKLFQLIDSKVNFSQIEDIKWNIEVFRRFCN